MNDLNETKERPGFWATITCSSGTREDRQNELKFAGWCLGWAISLVVATRLLKSGALGDGPFVWLLVVAPNLIAVVAVLAYLRFLRMADELIRKIQLDGLAIGFAVAAVVGVGYPLFEFVGLPPLEANDIVVIMMFSWAIGTFIGWRRFR